MNFFEERFDLLDLFRVLDPPPCLEDILLSSAVNHSTKSTSNRPSFGKKASKNKQDASVVRSINLMQPKPKVVFIPTPSYSPPSSEIFESTVASEHVANLTTKNRHTKSLLKPKTEQAYDFFQYNILNSAPFENKDCENKLMQPKPKFTSIPTPFYSPPASGIISKSKISLLKPKTESLDDFFQYNNLNSASFENMNQHVISLLKPKIEPALDLFQYNIPNSAPVLNKSQHMISLPKPKTEPAYDLFQYSVPNSSPFQNTNQNTISLLKPKTEPAYHFLQYNNLNSAPFEDMKAKKGKVKYNYSQMMNSTAPPMQTNHRCPKCGKIFPTTQSLGGHMSSHFKSRKREHTATFEQEYHIKKPCL